MPAPSGVMQSGVFALAHHLKIRDDVVQAIAISVMDLLVLGKWPPEMARHYQTMFKDVFPRLKNRHVSEARNLPTTIPAMGCVSALWRAKTSSVCAIWMHEKLRSALLTCEESASRLVRHGRFGLSCVAGLVSQAPPGLSLSISHIIPRAVVEYLYPDWRLSATAPVIGGLMSGDDVSNIERLLTALQSSFDEHLGGAEEREAKRERDHQELVQRVSALERDRDGWRSSLETAIAACLDARFPDLWTRERERERQALEEQRARERQETIDAISNVFRWPLRISQYLLPILTLISILIALFR